MGGEKFSTESLFFVFVKFAVSHKCDVYHKRKFHHYIIILQETISLLFRFVLF